MNNLTKGLAVIVVILAIGVGLVFWKVKVGGHGGGALTRVTKEDMALILKDASPMQRKQLAASPDSKRKIAENIKQLLAVASQARKEGAADDPTVKYELESIRSIVTASLYDKKISGGDEALPPFSRITEEQVKEYQGKPQFEEEFKKFLDGKITLAKESGRFPKDKELTEEETNQAKDDFTKVKIYEEEAVAKRGELGEEFNRNLDLQIGLQQAQFLASRYAQKTLVEKVKVSDDDVKNYIAAHPEFDTKEKRTKAEQILSRAKAGEDFAKLAGEFSEDPGSKDNGGLYENVTMGKMVPAFEQAALALEPGKIADNLVETPYGYHIIKLEKKGEGKDPNGQPAQTYDVRHILIMTTVKDESNPMGRDMPIAEKVKADLEEEKQKQVLDEIVANNPVEVAEDFEIPQPTEEEMQQMQQQQMMQRMGGGMQPGGMQPGAMPMPPPDSGKGVAKDKVPAKPAQKK